MRHHVAHEYPDQRASVVSDVNALDPRVDRQLRCVPFYDARMVGAYLDALRAHPDIAQRLRRITHPDVPAGDHAEAVQRCAEVEQLACDKAVRHVLRKSVAAVSRRWFLLMAALGVFWLAVGAGARVGFAASGFSAILGNGLLIGGVLTIVVALVAHVRTVMSLPGRDVAAVNLAYAGRVIDGEEMPLDQNRPRGGALRLQRKMPGFRRP